MSSQALTPILAFIQDKGAQGWPVKRFTGETTDMKQAKIIKTIGPLSNNQMHQRERRNGATLRITEADPLALSVQMLRNSYALQDCAKFF